MQLQFTLISQEDVTRDKEDAIPSIMTDVRGPSDPTIWEVSGFDGWSRPDQVIMPHTKYGIYLNLQFQNPSVTFMDLREHGKNLVMGLEPLRRFSHKKWDMGADNDEIITMA